MRRVAFKLLCVCAGFFVSTALGSAAVAANRIITLAPVISEWTAELLGDAEAKVKILAVSEYSYYPSFLKSVQTVGAYHQLNIEKIAALKPDLILASSEYNRPEQLEQLRRLNLPVRVLPREDFDHLSGWIKTLGLELGKLKQAENASKAWAVQLAALREKRRSVKRSLFLEVQHQPLVTIGGDGFLNEAFRAIGYENVFKDLKQSYPKVSKEAVLKANPETIFILDLGGRKEDFESARKDWQSFENLKAVKEGKVLMIAGDDFGRCSFRLLEALKKL